MIMTPWGRVGSNLLMNSFGQVVGPIPRRMVNENFNLLHGAEAQIAWIRDFYMAPDNPPLVGSKQNIRSVSDPGGVSRVMAELQIPLVRLRRDNLVKIAVSQLRAEIYAKRTLAETGIGAWGVRPGREALGPEPLDPQRFVQVADTARRAGEMLAAFTPPTPTLDLEYAELLDGAEAASRRLCGWLGIPVARAAKPAFVKATPDALAEAVPNLADLRQALRASALADLEWMFDA